MVKAGLSVVRTREYGRSFSLDGLDEVRGLAGSGVEKGEEVEGESPQPFEEPIELSTSELEACELPEAGRTSSRDALHANNIRALPRPSFPPPSLYTKPSVTLQSPSPDSIVSTKLSFIFFLFTFDYYGRPIPLQHSYTRAAVSAFFIHSFHVSVM